MTTEGDSTPNAKRSRAEIEALREELFRRAGIGEITGEEADAEAERLGIGRLSSKPDPAKFDPETVAYWPLPMIVAWIAYRTNDAVRDAWADYRAGCCHWWWRQWREGVDGPVREGWHLEQLRPPSLARLGLGAAFQNAKDADGPQVSITDAIESLWFSLREGAVRATGIDLETEKRVEIPPIEWAELRPYEAKNGSDEVRFGPFGTGYRAVELPSKGVRWIWPEPQPPVVLPDTVPPDGDGYMPLFLAGLWIATEGGAETFDPTDESVWRSAFSELLAAIASEKVRVVGTKDGNRVPVPSYLFADCRVDYPLADASIEMIMSEELYLRSHVYTGEDDWRRGFDDALVNRYGNHWSRLVVSKEDVRARWPFAIADTGGGSQTTGMPGRPGKAKHLIHDELERRGKTGTLADGLDDQARQLLDWVKTAHPSEARPTLRTLKNNIRDTFRRLKASTK